MSYGNHSVGLGIVKIIALYGKYMLNQDSQRFQK